jgi:uncharacterized protein YdcH (DUF465 family)
MLTKEISEVEKGCGHRLPNFGSGSSLCGTECKNTANGKVYCIICHTKLSTLKSAQQKFDGLNEKLKIIDYRIKEMESNYKDMHIPLHIQFLFDEWKKVRDELSSKQEEANG